MDAPGTPGQARGCDRAGETLRDGDAAGGIQAVDAAAALALDGDVSGQPAGDGDSTAAIQAVGASVAAPRGGDVAGQSARDGDCPQGGQAVGVPQDAGRGRDVGGQAARDGNAVGGVQAIGEPGARNRGSDGSGEAAGHQDVPSGIDTGCLAISGCGRCCLQGDVGADSANVQGGAWSGNVRDGIVVAAGLDDDGGVARQAELRGRRNREYGIGRIAIVVGDRHFVHVGVVGIQDDRGCDGEAAVGQRELGQICDRMQKMDDVAGRIGGIRQGVTQRYRRGGVVSIRVDRLFRCSPGRAGGQKHEQGRQDRPQPAKAV